MFVVRLDLGDLSFFTPMHGTFDRMTIRFPTALSSVVTVSEPLFAFKNVYIV